MNPTVGQDVTNMVSTLRENTGRILSQRTDLVKIRKAVLHLTFINLAINRHMESLQ